jgi:DNA-binding CsgD family transcriptional regulator
VISKKPTPENYNLFIRFIEAYHSSAFRDIDRKDPLVMDLEALMENNQQFFFVADLIEMKIIFTSKGSKTMLGIDPWDMDPYRFFMATHPEDIQRHSLGRSKLFKLAQDHLIARQGTSVLSTNIRMKDAQGIYHNTLVQCYVFFSSVAGETVYELQLMTNIDWFKQLKRGYHYYVGDDLSNFRYPDEKLLMMGNVLSEREFEIIKLIASGLNSREIAEKIFLSPNTINTHRRNILRKTGKATLSELINDLRERGFF